MWCTRWFIPLFLLPVPTTRPYFLILYLISAFFHARPCVYCIVVLISLFLTSCYWSPTPMSSFQPSTLSGLNSTEQAVTWQVKSVEMLSRCWCDFQRTPLFGQYNVGDWEFDSVKSAVEHQIQIQSQNQDQTVEDASELFEVDASSFTSEEKPTSWPRFTSLAVHKWRTWTTRQKSSDPLSTPAQKTHEESQQRPTAFSDNSKGSSNAPPQEQEQMGKLAQAQSQPRQRVDTSQSPQQPWLRRKYDLRTIGIDLIIDFGWRRE